MPEVVGIGIQDFEEIRVMKNFYVDKTAFIEEWWETNNKVTLVTRPRRFGKTLNMSMLNCFFSNKYSDRGDLFEKLYIWKNEKYQKLQGIYPVISLTFAGIKPNSYAKFLENMKILINNLYLQFQFLQQSQNLSPIEKKQLSYFSDFENNLSEVEIEYAIYQLCICLQKHFEKKVIILLDEYDTPMQEAYTYGYWEDAIQFMRGFFNTSFKTNSCIERVIMTGITRVSKESIFSDFNHLKVVTTTSDQFETAFGFTEEEVFSALDRYGLGDKKSDVKEWYDGFTFGKIKDIYNPWSIINYLQEKKLAAYWANTSSNSLASTLIQKGSPDLKQQMEQLLNGEELETGLDEQIVFNQLDNSEEAVWGLLVASGYLKIVSTWQEKEGGTTYLLRLTNHEVYLMFKHMIKGWFQSNRFNNTFIKALLQGDIKAMNVYINQIAKETFSSFDTGKKASEFVQPERFYHGFVLGLLVELRGRYEIKSNRESGFGRYDVALIPIDTKGPAIVIEFKVIDADEEKSLEETVQNALKQIVQRDYDAELIARGIAGDKIRHYGFAFRGKEVLIG